MYSMLISRRFRQLVAGVSLLAAVHGVGAALLPLGFGLGLVTGISATSLILPLVASTVLVGGALALLSLGAPPGGPVSEAPITVHLNPQVPLKTPPGWTPPVSPAIQPTPPSSTSSTAGHTSLGYFGTTPLAACMAHLTALYGGGTCTPLSTVCAGSNIDYARYKPNGVYIGNGCTMTAYQCPAGYTVSGSTCNLSNSSLVQKPSDGTCAIIRNGNVFSGDTNDPDCSILPSGISGLGTSTLSWSGGADGTDGGGSVTINNDNSVTITNTVNNPGGDRTVTTINGSAPATDGTVSVTGKIEGDYAGQGTAATSSSAPALQIPSDYNRETTQQGIKGVLDQLKTGQCGGPGQPACVMSEDGVSDASSAMSSSVSSSESDRDSAFAAREALITGQSAGVGPGMDFPWQIDPGSCAPLVMDSSRGLEFDLCSKIPLIHEVLSYFFYVFTALGIFALFFSKGEK